MVQADKVAKLTPKNHGYVRQPWDDHPAVVPPLMRLGGDTAPVLMALQRVHRLAVWERPKIDPGRSREAGCG